MIVRKPDSEPSRTKKTRAALSENTEIVEQEYGICIIILSEAKEKKRKEAIANIGNDSQEKPSRRSMMANTMRIRKICSNIIFPPSF